MTIPTKEAEILSNNDLARYVLLKNADGSNYYFPETSAAGLPVDVLGTPSRVTPQTLTGTSQSVALLTTTRRVSVDVSVNAIVRLNAAASLPANGSSLTNAIAIPIVTKDYDVTANFTLHFIRDGAADGTIRISEIV